MEKNVIVDIAGAMSPRDILKAELSRRGISYQQLATLMGQRGWKLNKASVDNRMSRGSFGADFFLDSLRVIGCDRLGASPFEPDKIGEQKKSIFCQEPYGITSFESGNRRL